MTRQPGLTTFGSSTPANAVVKRPESYGARCDGTTDDTAAIKAAIDAAVAACIADGTYYCEVQFSAGVYLVSSATTKGGATRGNAQIPLPAREPTAGQKVTIVLRGLDDSGAWVHWLQTTSQRSGAVIRTTLTGQTPDGTWKSPSVIGTNTVDLASGSVFSNIRVVVDGLTVVAPINPSVIAMDLRGAAQASVMRFTALADGIAGTLNGSATNDNGIGLYMPAQNNNASVDVGVYHCEGFYYGLGGSDHLNVYKAGLIYCNTAVYIDANLGTYVHGATFQQLSIEAAATCLEKRDTTDNRYPIWIGALHTETGTGTDIKDVGNRLRGYIAWAANDGSDPSVTGCAHVKIENVNRLRGQITPPAVPATTVATTPIFRDAAVTVVGGTVTAITVDGTATGLTSGTVLVPSGKAIALTYSSAPTWTWVLL